MVPLASVSPRGSTGPGKGHADSPWMAPGSSFWREAELGAISVPLLTEALNK